MVIDVQNGFVNVHTRSVVPTIVRLVKAWQAFDAPVVVSRFHNSPGSPYEKISGWVRLRSAEEQALVGELVPHVDAAVTVIDKSQSSIFTPEATQLVRDAGWTDLVLCGIDTDACVYDSAIAAYHAGYRPWIVTDACASTGGHEYHDAALLLAARNIGPSQLLTYDAVLNRIGGQGARS